MVFSDNVNMISQFPFPTMIDTHCHLTDSAFSEDISEVIDRARKAGIKKIVLACVDNDDFIRIIELQKQYPDFLIPSIGIHPEEMELDINAQLARTLYNIEQHPEVCVIGEIGLDLHWDKSRLEDQIKILTEQVRFSLQTSGEHSMTLLIHVRDAMEDFLKILPQLATMASEVGKRLRGILHCFAGTADDALAIMEYGDFYFGIGGIVTYKKSDVPEVAKAIGLKRIVLETDAPYLSPVPHRGKRNEPAHLRATAEYLSTLFEISLQIVEETTTRNAEQLLGKSMSTTIRDCQEE